MKRKRKSIGKRIIADLKSIMKSDTLDMTIYDRDPNGNFIRTKMKVKVKR